MALFTSFKSWLWMQVNSTTSLTKLKFTWMYVMFLQFPKRNEVSTVKARWWVKKEAIVGILLIRWRWWEWRNCEGNWWHNWKQWPSIGYEWRYRNSGKSVARATMILFAIGMKKGERIYINKKQNVTRDNYGRRSLMPTLITLISGIWY